MITIDVMQDASEIVHYDNPKIPLYIQNGLLSSYPDMRALCHWHEDLECIYILDGEMNYDVNGHKRLLQKGDTLVINSKQMHYGYSNHKHQCSFLCIIFHPSMLMSHPYTTTQYLTPILNNSSIESIYFANRSTYAEEIGQLLQQMITLKENVQNSCYELHIIAILYQLWTLIYQTCKAQGNIHDEHQEPTDLLIQKKMVSYIYQNYSELLSLDDIAGSGNVSRSKCCILFKKYLQQSPVDFLNAYRLEVSCNLLKNTKESISSIALACGFNHLSYYSKIFFRKYNCTPSAYRCNHLIK